MLEYKAMRSSGLYSTLEVCVTMVTCACMCAIEYPGIVGCVTKVTDVCKCANSVSSIDLCVLPWLLTYMHVCILGIQDRFVYVTMVTHVHTLHSKCHNSELTQSDERCVVE